MKFKIDKSFWFSLAGTLMIPVVAYAAAKDTEHLAQELSERRNANLSKTDAFKLKVKCYWKTVLCCGVAMGLNGVGTYLSNKKISSLSNEAAVLGCALGVSKSQFSSYRKTISDTLGCDTEKDVCMRAAEREMIPPEISNSSNDDSMLFRDSYSGEWFKRNKSDVVESILKINKEFVYDSRASYNSFRIMLGLCPIPLKENFGWSAWDDQVYGHIWIPIELRNESDDLHGPYCEIVYVIPPYEFTLKEVKA